MSNVQNTLNEREKRYGKFMDNASTAQFIKEVMRESPMWSMLEYDQAEALDLIASKIGRMLSGDVNYIDSWHDIAGYATLVENRLNGDEPMTATDVLKWQAGPLYGTANRPPINVTVKPLDIDPRPKAPLSSPHMHVWDAYVEELRFWNQRNPGMDV